MKKSVKRKLITTVSVLAVIVLAVVIYYSTRPKPAPEYATETVQRGDIENTVLANGMLQAYKLVNVGAQVSGQIKSMAVELGQEVNKGDLIAQIDSLTQQNSLKNTQASLNSIKAQYRAKVAQIHQAELEFARQKAMLADNASSKADYEAADANLTVYKAELEQLIAQQAQAEIQVDNAKVDLGYTTISAPMDGTVVYSAVEVGQTVNSNQTTPTIIELAQLDKMTVKAQISEADVVNVKPGQQVYFTILGNPNKKYFATLRAIEPGPTSMDGNDKDMTSSDSEAIYYNGLFDVDNADRALRIGMTAQVSIVLQQAEDALLVPAQVLQLAKSAPAKANRRANGAVQYQVPVLVNGELQYRDVKVGINNKVYAQITDGLQEGDEVVIGMPTGTSYSSRFGRSVRL
ncbi:efflux RND transporter periplasmic adaptor subunit [Shewanella sp. C32]|uniref:Efflux RND transporter periplasmic adaptor subunit n=1 Tax=Shewanella electrica TaxID=515560 RepID=A0ABT2FK00_9GAMM|nr:efflux RND transporter periplasmic adaptor subunit [Shewanella electrica]MCH1924440.1 efflux RND transporter periplasmic adaptor subunit [Shewanella electrica]MCS4556341.1 efflux RND transporter periplasmic adaptor subunit [Shewanella electrica]